MNIAVSYGRTGVLLAAWGALLVSGCGGEPRGASDADADSIAASPSDLYFETQADAFEWIARTAEERHLGIVNVKRDEAGKVKGVLIDRKVVNSDPTVGNDLMKALGAPRAVFHIGDEIIHMVPEESAPAAASADGVGKTTSALSAPPSSAPRCAQNGFCTDNSSYKHNYWFYRSIGSSTSQTQGGITIDYQWYGPWRDSYQTYDSWGNPYIAYGPPYCDNPNEESYGDSGQLTSCKKTIITGTNSLGISNVYFSKLGANQPNPFPILVEQASNVNVLSLDLGKWAVGIFVIGCAGAFGPAECDIDGVCGTHFSTGNGGSTLATTSAGSVDGSCM